MIRCILFLAALLNTLPLIAQTAPAAKAEASPWDGVRFLAGSWTAQTKGGSANAAVTGSYSFTLELKQHVMARHTDSGAKCSGPQDFDCNHSDLLYLYEEGKALKAIYFDNEGHVIHYAVTVPQPNKAVFLSEAAEGAPQFRLTYELRDKTMYGTFEFCPPGGQSCHAYLAWEGGKR